MIIFFNFGTNRHYRGAARRKAMPETEAGEGHISIRSVVRAAFFCKRVGETSPKETAIIRVLSVRLQCSSGQVTLDYNVPSRPNRPRYFLVQVSSETISNSWQGRGLRTLPAHVADGPLHVERGRGELPVGWWTLRFSLGLVYLRLVVPVLRRCLWKRSWYPTDSSFWRALNIEATPRRHQIPNSSHPQPIASTRCCKHCSYGDERNWHSNPALMARIFLARLPLMQNADPRVELRYGDAANTGLPDGSASLVSLCLVVHELSTDGRRDVRAKCCSLFMAIFFVVSVA